MQVAVVQGRKPVDILGDEIGDVEARVNEERITQDDFAGAGGAVDSEVSSHDMMWALMLRSRQGPATVLSFGLIWTCPRDWIAWRRQP